MLQIGGPIGFRTDADAGEGMPIPRSAGAGKGCWFSFAAAKAVLVAQTIRGQKERMKSPEPRCVRERHAVPGKEARPCAVALRLMPWIAACIAIVGARAAGTMELRFSASRDKVVLRGPDAAQQLVLAHPDGSDATHVARWQVEPPMIAVVEPGGRLRPTANGTGRVIARLADGSEASAPIEVVSFGESQPVHFANRVVPIFTKYGCNGGGCHGKAAGQDGFRLSLLEIGRAHV